MIKSIDLSITHAYQWLISTKEEARRNAEASHCCPNCDGPITVGEHETTGICNDCHDAVTVFSLN